MFSLPTSIERLDNRMREWMLKHADTPMSQFWLSVISFLEASILPLPPSAFMLAMISLSKRKRWFYLAFLTTVMSVLGGLFGYLIGFAVYDTVGKWIVEHYGLASEINRIGNMFHDNAFWALFFGALTPVPYKAFAISGGFFSVDLSIFIISSFLGRGLRFFILGYLAKVFGEQVAKGIFKYFVVSVIAAMAIIVLIVLWQSF